MNTISQKVFLEKLFKDLCDPKDLWEKNLKIPSQGHGERPFRLI